MRQYFLSTKWLAGFIADLGGGLIMIGAYSSAPVSIIQPVAGVNKHSA